MLASQRTILTLGLVALFGSTLGVAEVAALPPLLTHTFNACPHFPAATAVEVTESTTPDDPVGIANCNALCDRWVIACKGAVDATKACFTKALAKFAMLEASLCKVQGGAARELCNDELKATKIDPKSQVDTSRNSGIGYCETTGLFSCVVNCS